MDEQRLRLVIVQLLRYMKADHEDAAMLANELAALRSALDELSKGKFQPILDKHRDAMKLKTEELRASIVADYDDLIRKIQNGELF